MNKTVAIITMHRVFNFGSILQTVALSKYLEKLRYQSIIIDYKFPNSYHKNKISQRQLGTKKVSWLRLHLNGLCNRWLKKDKLSKTEKFERFLKNNLKLSDSYESPQELLNCRVTADIYLTGSDQVWNPRWIFDDVSFFVPWISGAKKLVSFGSSFGGKDIDDNYLKLFSPYLKRYNTVSVREDNNVLKKIGIDFEIVLDPTFLLNKEQWKEYISENPIVKGKYILCYLIDYSFNPFPFAYKVLRRLCRLSGYKVVMIGAEQLNILKGYKVFNECGPEEFLNLFYNASFILTSSFHGTAFAINFNKPFISIVDDVNTNDNRQRSLVKSIIDEDYGILKKNSSIKHITKNCIKKMPKFPNLETMRDKSRDFLINALEI